MDQVKTKTSFTFNRICINFLKDIKNKDANLKKKIKKNYKVYDKSSHTHIAHFWSKMEPVHDIIQTDSIAVENLPTYIDTQLLNNALFCDIYFLKGLQIGKLFEIFSDEKPVILSYILTLYLFSYLYSDINEDNYEDINILLQKTLSVIHSIDSENNISSLLEDILDDTIKNIIIIIKSLKIQMLDNEKPDSNINLDNYESLIENSKIGNLAKDIFSTIDLDKMNIDPNSSPENIIGSIFSGSNNIIGDLITQVGTNLNDKMQKGELNQQELMTDAFKLVGQFGSQNSGGGGNDFMADLMKNVVSSLGNTKGGEGGAGGFADMFANMNENGLGNMFAAMNGAQGQGKPDINKMEQNKNKSDTKERLRKKLQEKEKAKAILALEK